MGQLILKRANCSRSSGQWKDDDYDVIADGVAVGRIFNAAASPVGSNYCRPKLSPSIFVDLCPTNFPEVHMSTQLESKKAKLVRPADYYKSPVDITQDTELSPDEKRQALNTWEQDARQMMTESNEGMEGDEEGLDQRDTHRLGEVVRAKEKIGAKPKHKPSQ